MAWNRRDHEKYQRITSGAANRERDEAALEVLEPGMGARGGGISGFIEEVDRERGKVHIASYERGTTVPAREVEPTNPQDKERFDRALGAYRHDISDLEARYGLEDL